MVPGGFMMKRNILITLFLLLMFFILILLLATVDVQPVENQHSSVGLATINKAFHQLIGVHLQWYAITDWLGIVALLTASVFAFTGFVQLIRRKSLCKVDVSLLILGVCYVAILLCYAFFERVVVNYRPIMLSCQPEASFPSSHTMIVLFIMGTANIQFRRYICNHIVRKILQSVSSLIIIVTIFGRLYSGVHWLTDIIGGILLGSSLILMFRGATSVRKLSFESSPKI